MEETQDLRAGGERHDQQQQQKETKTNKVGA